MKKILLACAGLTLALSFLWVGVAAAANVRSGDAPRIMRDEVINGTLYSAGGDLKMEGTVQGDLMCAGQNVEITGIVEGDVLCIGQNVTVSGHVLGDVRIAGQNVDIKGKVDGSVSLAGQIIDVDSAATIARDVTILGQQISLAGTIGRDVEALGDIFGSSAKIGRDLDVTAPSVTLRNGSEVAGMFMYVSAQDASIDSGAKVVGKIEHKQPPKEQTESSQVVSPSVYLSSVIFSFSSFLAIGAAMLVGAPRVMRAATHAITASPLATLGTGFMALFLPPFVAVVLFITAIGMPLAVIIFLGWIITLLLGMVFTAQVIGRIIITKIGWHDPWRHYVALVLGLFVIFLSALLPFIGGIVILLAVVWGAGGLLYAAFKRRGPILEKEESKKNA